MSSGLRNSAIVVVTIALLRQFTRRPDIQLPQDQGYVQILAIHCAYGDSLNDMLRERPICDTIDARIQQQLLAEAEIDFPKALQIVQPMESADRDAQDLQTLQSETLLMTYAAIHRAGGSDTNRQGGVNIKTVTGVGGDIGILCVGTKRLCAIYVPRKAMLLEPAEARTDIHNLNH